MRYTDRCSKEGAWNIFELFFLKFSQKMKNTRHDAEPKKILQCQFQKYQTVMQKNYRHENILFKNSLI